ncbi:MAG: dihydropteroate synthase [Tannerella sp.]|jgi:dihydropteroate synthase|nr:dihydropteroate synthase [Tannerella sp.]
MNIKSLNIKGQLWTLDEPFVMGILNVTPDSFYGDSRAQTGTDIRRRIETVLAEGGRMIDVGGYSSRPDAADVSVAEERRRLMPALELLNTHYPDVAVSIDTFRADVAQWAVEEYGVAVVNDISGGTLDARMFETVARLRVPYVLMHIRGTPQTMRQLTDYADLTEEIMLYFAEKLRALRLLGVNDVILDPGFGFAKTLEQNYELMRSLPEFAAFEAPLLVGISRKRMISGLLDVTAGECLNGTTVLHTFALLNGATILRVHDVKAAVEAVKITAKLKIESIC